MTAVRSVVATAAVLAALTGCHSDGTAAGSLASKRVISTILIDADSHETFAPPPSGTQPQLSAEQAWRAMQQMRPSHHPIRPLPSTTYTQLGLLTSPPSITDVLAWGYRTGPVACVYTGFVVPKPRGHCYMWQFLRARDGHFLEGTEQQLRLTHVTPTPISTHQLLTAGFVSGETSRFAPDEIEYQAPESVIRWTFDETHCRIEEHWFATAYDASSPSKAPCSWHHRFSIDAIGSLAGREGDFEVVAGHQAHRYGEYVRATLADGTKALYSFETDAAWIFVVQRCGADPARTAVTRIDEVTAKGRHVNASVPVKSPTPSCSS